MRDRSDTKTVKNANYEKDLHYALQLIRWVLKPIGIWSLVQGFSSTTEKFITLISIIVCSFALYFVLLPCGFHAIFREKDIDLKVKLAGPMSFCLISTLKYYYIAIHRRDFFKCIEHVKKGWQRVDDEEHREIMLRQATVGRNLTVVCAVFLYMGGVSYHTIMPLVTGGIARDNTTIRPLTYPGYDAFFDVQSSPTYEFIFFSQFVYALVCFNITTAACSLAALFVTYTCGQVEIVMAYLNDLVEGKNSKDSNVEERLGNIVKRHIEAIRFSSHVDEVLRGICLCELVICTLIICLLEYYVITEWENSDGIALTTYFLLLVSFTFDIFIFCYIGELLVEQCSQIGIAAYQIDWYYLPENKALGIIMIIAMSSYPPKLTAGKIVELSLNTFGSTLKTSLVYLNLLRTVTE